MRSSEPERSAARRTRRIVVVSPHLDDAVISLGATISRLVQEGREVAVLTVFACDPGSTAPTAGWEARAGFATEGEAARARREEDAAACAELGAMPEWLPFGSVDFERHGDESEVREAVAGLIGGEDDVLLPGYPLTHPDHLWLTTTLTSGAFHGRRVGFFAEEPYTARAGARRPALPDWLGRTVGADVTFQRAGASTRDWLAKRRAVLRYRSQLPLLGLARRAGLPLERLLVAELRAGGEAVACPTTETGQPQP